MVSLVEVAIYSSSENSIVGRILDEQTAKPTKKCKAPGFMPISPAPVPQAAISKATISVSRLFTKAIHTSSTQPPSPPRQSALRHGLGNRSAHSLIQSSASTSGRTTSSAPSTSTVGSGVIISNINWTKSNLMGARLEMLPDILNASVAKAFHSAESVAESGQSSTTASGQSTSTIKHISFAEFPVVKRSQDASLRFREKWQARRERRRSRGSAMLADAVESNSDRGGRWSGRSEDGRGDGTLAGLEGGNIGIHVFRLEKRETWDGPCGIERSEIGGWTAVR